MPENILITMDKARKNSGGQALLFVVVALTISMVVGVSVATRTLSVTKRVSSTDTQAKVYYAAEAGIERFINQPSTELTKIAAGNGCGTTGATAEAGVGCHFILGTGTTYNVETKTTVTVQSFVYNESNPSPHYSTILRNGTFSSVALIGYTGTSLDLCWRNQPAASGENTALYYTLWSASSLLGKALIIPAGNQMDSNLDISGSIDAGAGRGEYTRCKNVLIPAASVPSFINIMSVGGDSKVGVFPTGASDLPSQGFQITSKATLNSASDLQQQVVKIIEAVRTYDHVPGFFDSAIYAQGDIIAD